MFYSRKDEKRPALVLTNLVLQKPAYKPVFVCFVFMISVSDPFLNQPNVLLSVRDGKEHL